MLPKNEPKEINITPKNFLIWGENMAGKTYLATQFPNPILLNTDGNATKISTPSLDIRTYQQFTDALNELAKGGHEFESVIIDLIDDIKVMSEKYVLKKLGLSDLSEKMNKGYGESNKLWFSMVSDLTKLPYNIIFISHMLPGNAETIRPALAQRQLNVCMGRCDVSIYCEKNDKFNKYSQICDRRRHDYKPTDFKNEQIRNILTPVKNLFNK